MFGSGLFGSPRAPKYSLGPVNVAFPTPQRLPPGVGVGSLAPGRRHLGRVIEDKTAQGLRAAGLNNHDANRWAGKLFGAFNDLTPLGNVTGADDGARMAYQGLTHGNLKTGLLGAGMFAASVLPYGGKVKRPLRELMGDTSGAIRAWHGSPHDFDKFEWSPRTRGTGEGAQAYGDGLYFAENRDVARAYRDKLTEGEGRWVSYGGRRISEHDGIETLNPKELAAYTVANHGGNVEDAVSNIEGLLPFMSGYPKEVRGEALSELMADPGAFRGIDWGTGGNLYEVGINAEPEEFLDWHKPLSEQSGSVQQSIDRARQGLRWRGADMLPEYSGGTAYRSFFDSGLIPIGSPYSGLERARAPKMLNDAGIPGIRFLDQGSRGAGNGTSNYVVFDDKLIDILNKF